MLSSDAITNTAVFVVDTIKYISLMPELNSADALEDNVLRNFGGAVENNLNHVLGNLSDTFEDLNYFYPLVVYRYVAVRGQTYLI